LTYKQDFPIFTARKQYLKKAEGWTGSLNPQALTCGWGIHMAFDLLHILSAKENIMKRIGLSVFAALFLALLLNTPVWAWQGRMAGVGDANGLIEDESDYLIHPSAITAGSGLNFYGNYRMTYDNTTKWDYSISSPAYSVIYPYSTSGHAWKNEGQLGAAFPLGSGRMGVFFEYTGIVGKYSGEERYAGFWSDSGQYNYDLKNDLDNYALRVIYGLPVQNVKLGGELQIAYRNEKQETILFAPWGVETNYPWAAEDWPEENLYPYMIPYKSKYWDAQGKVSVEGFMGPAKYDFTLKGGTSFASDNQYAYAFDYANAAEMNGKIKGFNIGGDFWLRFPVSDALVLPLILGTEYKTIKRDGSGLDRGTIPVTYDHETKNLSIKAGGGIDFTPAKGTRLAAGVYYDYISMKQNTYNDYNAFSNGVFIIDSYSDMPKQTENRLTLKALVEKELTPAFVLRGGFNLFYGLVKSDYAYAAYWNGLPYNPLNVSPSGSNVGVTASIGATVKFNQVTLEPFINGGYAHYSISGDGTYGPAPVHMELKKNNWLVGGGLSVKF
jgi:hypothetical protein